MFKKDSKVADRCVFVSNAHQCIQTQHLTLLYSPFRGDYTGLTVEEQNLSKPVILKPH